MIDGNLIGTFQIQTTKKNSIGEGVLEWSDVVQKKGFLDYVTGDTLNNTFSARIQESTHIFLCDWFDCDALGITSENARIIIEGQIYSVQIIDDPMGRNQHLEVYLKYTGGQLTTQ